MGGALPYMWKVDLMKLLLSLILIITITGPELVCLAGKLYYVSPAIDRPALVVDNDGKPVRCGND